MKEFSESVSPITVQTMQMVAGSSQYQFDFIIPHPGTDTVTVIDFPKEWDQVNKKLILSESTIRHYTFGNENNVLSACKSTDFEVKAPDSPPVLGDDKSDKAHYIYIVHPTGLEEDGKKIAYYDVTTTAHQYQEDGKYYFLTGILNSENDGDRGFIKMYGFTEITPGRITTDQIVSRDGLSVFDLAGNKMQLGKEDSPNRLSWNGSELEIVGRLKQLGGDNEIHDVGIYRGDYKETSTYYHGDTVTYPVGGEICTYHCTSEDPVKGHEPTESDYWQVVARGSKGDDGERGAPIIFRGEWKETNEYYGNPSRLDIVKLKNKDEYYITKIDSGVVPGTIVPGSEEGDEKDKKWSYFGAQFDSIATGLLFAKDANIGGWNLTDNHFISENGLVEMDGNQNSIYLSKRIYLDQNGLSLYEETVEPSKRSEGNIKAEISLKNIEESLDLGINTQEHAATIASVILEKDKICGVRHSEYLSHSAYKKNTGDLKISPDIIIGTRTKAYFRNLTINLTLHFRDMVGFVYGDSFVSHRVYVVPKINGESKDMIYYDVPIEMPWNNKQCDIPITLTCAELVSSIPSSKTTISFDVIVPDMSGKGEAILNCSLIAKVEKVVLETESERKTLIAPNGFYCYGGNKNLVWVTPNKVEIKGGQGPVISSGNFGFKITPEGFFKTSNFDKPPVQWDKIKW